MEEVIVRKKGLPRWVVVTSFVVLLGFLGILGWGLKNTQQGPVQVGQPVPAFSFTTFDGQTFNTAELRGKIIVVNFWASWCKPCEIEAADLERAWQIYSPSGEVYFFGVDYVDTERPALGYLEKFNITYPNGPDLQSSVSQLFRITGVPETYVINKDGTLADAKIGYFTSLAEIQAMIDPLLSQ